MSYREEPFYAIVLENAKLTIDRLYKLSFKIRNPATRLGFSKARSYRAIDEETGIDLMDRYGCYDLRHIAEIMAQHMHLSPEECESDDLVQRLAKANTNRRRQFGQWRRHKLKMDSVGKGFVQKVNQKSSAEAARSLLNIPQDSKTGALSVPSTATKVDENNVDLTDTASAISTSTYAAMFTEDDEHNISIPPLPKSLCTGKEFECPFCHVLCSRLVADKISWL